MNATRPVAVPVRSRQRLVPLWFGRTPSGDGVTGVSITQARFVDEMGADQT